ncbi:hypothetical protein PN466_16330 [Roseofilum reptotaenium CS-1145]|uniref:ATP-binding protein n=1 Tax=Roseofilum reptotaenium AO1-A TaxID=1925591 RepID=A0A1L9QWR6_9CYAN|nr:hypothetical protein [Roseofilum reptotaenium]MDB9518513.1 hypothetical protein [Roseofilum reptotaenium CS-1145]OJJ27076.1 hypothetical protein BI308_03245 [Roseofilum reptotaenium AO1-A]
MSQNVLANYFQLHRRYYRSVNLERDIDRSQAIAGYILTERSASTLERMVSAFTETTAHKSWTLTGVYGSGKSAFAHYIAGLCHPQDSPMRSQAVAIAREAFGENSPVMEAINTQLPDRGLLIAVATGRSEPLSWTIARALASGAERFWPGNGKKPKILRQLNDWQCAADEGKCQVKDRQILQALQEVANEANTHVLLILDELGKSLEFASTNKGVSDLYLLQQIAELQSNPEQQVYFLGLLHQSFAGYGDRLSTSEQNEWIKIQGRFEDMPFTDSPSQMTRLIGQAIDRHNADPILRRVQQWGDEWYSALHHVLSEQEIQAKLIEKIGPLHPLTALVLPLLCTRYAQNDRSLFTFLTSDEPYGFQKFLETTGIEIETDCLPTLKLHQLYDYFVENVTGLTSRFNLQRWVEIQGLIQDARDHAPETLAILKTIGVLNLITTTGKLRASPDLVALALCDSPREDQEEWKMAIANLQKQGLITYRRQAEELRIWEGSDFNVEAAIDAEIEKDRSSLQQLLSQVYPLKPLVVQRHYTQTGTLRYFERLYGDNSTNLQELSCTLESHDGLILYWLEPDFPSSIPDQIAHNKPLVMVKVNQLEELAIRVREFRALEMVKQAPELQNDGVARREVKHRRIEAKWLLDETFAKSLSWSGNQECWVGGEEVRIGRDRQFQSRLSDLCDRVYDQGLKLDNELINRRQLTGQGVKARRVLITAMIEKSPEERLGLTGYGPEVAIYYSVLETTGIHRQEEGIWDFYPPNEESGVYTLWNAIEQFCYEAQESQKSLHLLGEKLQDPPFGVKEGVIPIVFAAVLLYHSDDVGIYRDGSFIPVLGAEHFELLLKNPGRFSVKYFQIVGLRSQVFKELQSIFSSPQVKTSKTLRNASLLAVAKPLLSFVAQLPKYTRSTQSLNAEARKVLQTLQVAQEPDNLLFQSLPTACGLSPITFTDEPDRDLAVAKTYRQKLVRALHEIQTAYDRLLSDCRQRLHEAFGVRDEQKLRDDLATRATILIGSCIEPLLKRFILAAVDEHKSEPQWLESLVMIVADKPARSWTDGDVTQFEMTLSDLVRRFKNLESLQKDAEAAQSSGFTAKRITVTESDGREVHQAVWLNQAEEKLLETLVQKTLALEGLKDNPKRQQAFIAKLSEWVFGENVTDGEDQLDTQRKKRKNQDSQDQVL